MTKQIKNLKKTEAEKKIIEVRRLIEQRSKTKHGISRDSTSVYSIGQCTGLYHTTHFSIEAVENYRKNRENGEEIDNPKDEFPQDGKFMWATKRVSSKVKYIEGPQDANWMTEKDKNYLQRLQREINSLPK